MAEGQGPGGGGQDERALENDLELPAGVPPIDFNTFVLSLSTSALEHLGETPSGSTARAADLPLARQTIDLLILLEQKTRGNLTGEEERLLQQVVHDLKLRYLAAGRQTRT